MFRSLSFRTDVQGLRAVAVLAVMLFHYDRQLLPGGFIGVDIFFVISGFLITSILLKKKDNLNYSLSYVLKAFYLARITRIAPAYYMLLIAVSFIGAVVFIPRDYGFFHDSLEKSLWFVSNQYFSGFGDYFAPNSDELPLLHTWSLAVEMQFYLFYPFLILLFKKEWLKIIIPTVVASLLFVSAYQLSEGLLQTTYYGLYARVPEFLIGGYVVLFAPQIKKVQVNWLPIVGVMFIFFSFILINEKTPFPGLYALPSVLGVAIILSSFSDNKVSRILSNSLFVWIGAISYSLYLWHWPILAFIRYISGEYQLNLFQSLLYWGGAFMFASISYYCVEQYFRGSKLNTKAKVSWSAIAVALTLATTLTPQLNKNIVPSLPVKLTRYADPETICHGQIVGDCLRGDKDSRQQPILVLGDSHAAMLNHFFDVVGKELKVSFRVITSSSCMPIPDFDLERLVDWAQKPCQEQIKKTNQYIVESDTIVLISMWAWHFESVLFKQALNSFIDLNSDKNIILLSDVPNFTHYSPEKNYRLAYLGLAHKNTQLDRKVGFANNLLVEIAQNKKNVSYFELLPKELFKNFPFYNDSPLYFDTHHLNEYGSKTLAKLIQLKIKAKVFLPKGK